VKQIKANANYNESIGEALGIEGAQQAGPDYATLQPDISATINGMRVDIGWDWGGFVNFLDQIEIQVDRGDGHMITPANPISPSAKAIVGLALCNFRMNTLRTSTTISLFSSFISAFRARARL
jgi:hypothetical protein